MNGGEKKTCVRAEIPLKKRPKRDHASIVTANVPPQSADNAYFHTQQRAFGKTTLRSKIETAQQVRHSIDSSKIKDPRSVVSTTPSVSGGTTTGSWTPLPLYEAELGSAEQSYQNLLACAPMPTFEHNRPACTPLACTPLPMLPNNSRLGAFPAPPSLESRPSGKFFPLMAQPMIMSPTPTSFRDSHGTSGLAVQSQITDSTPLEQKPFHPTIFSVDSALSDPWHRLSGAKPTLEAFQSKISPLLPLAAQLLEPIPIASAVEHQHSAKKAKPATPASGGPSRRTRSMVISRNRETTVADDYSKKPKASKVKKEPLLKAKGGDLLPRAASKTPPQFDGLHDAEIDDIVCTCTRTNCLKLYCMCFQRGILCDKAICKCTGCKNTLKESDLDGARTRAVEAITNRRPDAFGKRVKAVGLGCSCKRNRCLKKYCSCFAEGVVCDDKKCSCFNCQNTYVAAEEEYVPSTIHQLARV